MPVKIKVDMEEFSFNVKLKEDPTPVISSWLKVFLGLEDNIPSYGLNSLPEMEMVDFLPWKKWWSEGAEVGCQEERVLDGVNDDGQLKQVVKRVRKGTDVQQYKKIEKRKEDNCGLVGEGSLLQENIKRVEKGCRVQNLSDIGREDSWVRKSRVNETEKGRCSARGNYGDGDTFSPFSDSKDKRGLQFQKVGNLTKDGSGGLQKEDGFDEPSHGSVVEADLSQLTGLKGLIENQELQMLEGPIGGVKVRLMGSLGTDHFEVSLDQGLDYEDGEIKSPKDMSCGGNVELCGNGSDGMELSILAPVSVEVLKSGDEGCVKSPITLGKWCGRKRSYSSERLPMRIRSPKDLIKKAVDGNSPVRKDGNMVRGLSVVSSGGMGQGLAKRCSSGGLNLGPNDSAVVAEKNIPNV
ncbi:hypothetical protein Q3G72_022270 [Acer saccharum]|nr:hypothetical protein Q3G72_022270 [Acer saccharum]